jgi:hypothetical protein
MSTKKYPSTEEVEHNEKHSKHDRLEVPDSPEEVKEREKHLRHDRLEGDRVPEPAPERPKFYPIGNPQDPGREVTPEPWDNQEFYDKVRAAGFPTSSYGDAAFMQACYNLATAVQPPPPERHAEKAH